MQPASRLGRQIQELLEALASAGVAVALIGGLTLAPYRVVRATRDVDLVRVRAFFRLFDREALLDEILHEAH